MPPALRHISGVPEPWPFDAKRERSPPITWDSAVGRVHDVLRIVCRHEGWGIQELTDALGAPREFSHHGKMQPYRFPPKVQFIPLYTEVIRHELFMMGRGQGIMSEGLPAVSFCVGMMPTKLDPTRELFVHEYWTHRSPLDGLTYSKNISPPFPITGWSKYHLLFPQDTQPILAQDSIQSGHWDKNRGRPDVEALAMSTEADISWLVGKAVRGELSGLLERAESEEEKKILEGTIIRLDKTGEFRFAYRDRLLLFGPLGISLAESLGLDYMTIKYAKREKGLPGERSVYDRTRELLQSMGGRRVKISEYELIESAFREYCPNPAEVIKRAMGRAW